INDFPLIPDYAVLDARLTVGLPPFITATTGMDALVHAAEAFIGRSTTKKTRTWAVMAVRLIRKNLLRAYENGEDLQARQNMLKAAFLAGEAFSMSYVGYVHGIAHSLGGQYGVPHGLANAVVCPYVFRQYDFAGQKRLAVLARAAGVVPADAEDRQAAQGFIKWFEELNSRMGIPDKLDCVKEEDIPVMAACAEKESNPLYPVPKLMTKEDLEQIYRLLIPDENKTAVRPGNSACSVQAAAVCGGVQCGKRTIEEILSAQRAFFDTGKTRNVFYRIQALKRLEAAIERHHAEIDLALKEDLGKSFFESYMCEVGLTLSELRYQAAHVREWSRPQPAVPNLAHFASKTFVMAEPYGVTLIMSPWNYPFMLTMEPLIGAVAAGNCCVVKPSAYSPKTSAIMAQVIEEAFEPGHVDVVLGGREQNKELLDKKFDYIFFTGSVAVGRTVLEKAAPHLTPVTLELGGKSPCFVAGDANLKIAAARIAFGKWLNLGQTCVAPDYVLVDSSVAENFVRLLCGKIGEMYGKDAFMNPDYGHMVNEKHFDRVMGLIDPEKVVYGGRGKRDTLQIEPTVMMNVTAEDAVMGEEIFGPVLPIVVVDSMEEALAFVKKRDKPLAAYVFTDDKAFEKRFLTEISFGGGCINDTIVHMATSRMAFGGVGASGMGSYHGKDSFQTFTHKKSILKKYNWLDMPLRYEPYNSVKLSLVKLFIR
ncbi:MAG: aldehyde dehydrogenase family protein, partial [Eubacterium sp.]|nr:aldehyde dehydrogenase family protein [Eubacterium sp.]